MLLAILAILGGLTLLLIGGELLVSSASRAAALLRVSPLVIGLTVVAFGTSSPELAVSVQSVLAGNADLAVGNVVGSNILNVLLILGLSALIVPLTVSSQLIRWDVPVMIAASVLLLAVCLDGRIGRIDGLLLFGGVVTYTYWCIRQARREGVRVHAEFQAEISTPRTGVASVLIKIALMAAGCVLLGVGSNWLIRGSVTIATHLGVSPLIIGLTIIAAGTSLPEVVTSIVAAVRGEREIAVGNAVGSNLFNILCVLGLTSIIAPDGISVSPEVLQFDLPVMLAVAIVCLPIFFTGSVIARWEGGLLFGYYLAYTTYIVLAALGTGPDRTLAGALYTFVLPLTVITLLVMIHGAVSRRRG